MNIIYLFLAFVTSFILVYYSIPLIIRVANANELYDAPDGKRKIHTTNTPRLGGVAVFSSIMLSFVCWGFAFKHDAQIPFIAATLIILFFTGLRDDISPMKARQKLALQLLATALMVLVTDLRVDSFFGILGVYELPYLASIAFSFFIVIVIINAMNLIDGIDGLAGGLSAIISLTFAVWFFMIDEQIYCLLGVLHGASQIAFLRFNFSMDPRLRIFMGDCGSMVAGGIISILCLRFIDTVQTTPIFLNAGPSIAIAILIIPLFDTLRVFVLRVSKGHSPFRADRNHLHHLFLNLGLTHRTTSVILYSINIGYIGFAFLISHLLVVPHLLIIFFSGLVILNFLPAFIRMVFKSKIQVLLNAKMIESEKIANSRSA
jgi:UDP-GlcNAc:undecaprenyl-phosphate GlcNAc-1-phosphate transferase